MNDFSFITNYILKQSKECYYGEIVPKDDSARVNVMHNRNMPLNNAS